MPFFTNSHSHGRIFGIHNERCRSCLANPESHCTIWICAVWIFWSRSGLGWWCGSWKCPIIIHDHFPHKVFPWFPHVSSNSKPRSQRPVDDWQRLFGSCVQVCFSIPTLKAAQLTVIFLGRLNHKPYPRNMRTRTGWYWWYSICLLEHILISLVYLNVCWFWLKAIQN